MQFKFLYLEEDVEEETALKKHNKNTQEVVFTASITKLLKGSSTWLRDRRGNITVACKVRSGMEKTSLWKQEAPNEPADSKLKKKSHSYTPGTREFNAAENCRYFHKPPKYLA